MALVARAPAKLNLCLYVGPRRDDGLHQICSLFQSMTLADELRLDASAGDRDEVVCPGISSPNLAARALEAFRNRFDWTARPVRLSIEKRIPVAAGLGGGSADAAAVLRLASEMSDIQPSFDELRSLAMTLGADVPSQLRPGTALVSGAGERVEPLEGSSELSAVLLTGRGALSTAEVYAHADRIGRADDLAARERRLRSALAATPDPLALGPLLENDLQCAAVELEPEAGRAVQLLREEGADVALVSGSGPAAFGLFVGTEEAERARRKLVERWPGDVHVAGPADAAYAEPRTEFRR